MKNEHIKQFVSFFQCKAESGCRPIGCRYDVYSYSCGYFQIKEEYWEDCGRPGTSKNNTTPSLPTQKMREKKTAIKTNKRKNKRQQNILYL